VCVINSQLRKILANCRRALEHDPEKHALGLRPDGWMPVFRKDHAPPERDIDSTSNDRALGETVSSNELSEGALSEVAHARTIGPVSRGISSLNP
jgi:hypothetical protein